MIKKSDKANSELIMALDVSKLRQQEQVQATGNNPANCSACYGRSNNVVRVRY